MNKRDISFYLVISFAIIMVGISAYFEYADAVTAERLYCMVTLNPSIEVNELTISLEQKAGICYYRSPNGNHYETPYYPIMYKISLIDMDFPDYILGNSTITTGNELVAEFPNYIPEISYCFKVDTYWHEKFNTTMKTTTHCELSTVDDGW